MADSPAKVKRDWKEIVEKSGGTMMFCPEKLLDDTKEWLKKKELLNSEIERISKIEIQTKIALENLVVRIREYLEETGKKGVWTSEVGFQGEALKEGLHIITIESK